MNRRIAFVATVILTIPAVLPAVPQSQVPAPITELRIDPLLVSTVSEYRNVMRTLGPLLFPGWQANSVPMLLYRPKVQELLIGAPRIPKGFSRFAGRPLLGDEAVYVRNDSTVMDLDDQNTSIELDSMQVLVVADQFSRLRSQLRDMFGRPAAMRDKWLEEWGFIPSPFTDLQMMVHEAFHVHQRRMAPTKSADESTVAAYLVLDPVNNAFTALEGMILRDALLAPDDKTKREKAAEFISVRLTRRAKLDSTAITYEDLNEFSEGLGRYVEMRFLQLADRVTPTPEMYLHAGFTGYRGAAIKEFRRQADDMVKIASNTDDRFGNKYGTGPLRFRLYYLGAAQGLLLDDLAPDWKRRIFARGVFLTGLLNEALALSPERRQAHLEQAKLHYGYDKILVDKEAFAADGQRLIRARVDSITGTRQTLVTIQYGAVGDKMGMGYTPFGVTAINTESAIYDLVPIAIRFANKVLLEMKSVVPVILDKRSKAVTFAVATPPAGFITTADGGLDLGEFRLSGSPGTTVTVAGNRVIVVLK